MLLLLTFLNCSGNFFLFLISRLFFYFLCLFEETENTLLTVIHTFYLSLRFHFEFCELFFCLQKMNCLQNLRIFFNVHQRCFSARAHPLQWLLCTQDKRWSIWTGKLLWFVYNEAVKNGLLFFVCLKVAICDSSVFYVTWVCCLWLTLSCKRFSITTL